MAWVTCCAGCGGWHTSCSRALCQHQGRTQYTLVFPCFVCTACIICNRNKDIIELVYLQYRAWVLFNFMNLQTPIFYLSLHSRHEMYDCKYCKCFIDCNNLCIPKFLSFYFNCFKRSFVLIPTSEMYAAGLKLCRLLRNTACRLVWQNDLLTVKWVFDSRSDSKVNQGRPHGKFPWCHSIIW